MSETLVGAVLCGALVGLGLTVLLRELLPRTPHLATALDRLSPPHASRGSYRNSSSGWLGGAAGYLPLDPQTSTGTGTAGDRLTVQAGLWALRRLPTHLLRPPTTDLALLRVPLPVFLGRKILFALLGLLFPLTAALLAAVIGIALPWTIPSAAGVLLAAGLFIVPDLNTRTDAEQAREEFARAVSAYADLTALERTAGSGATQALEQAATIGAGWVFQRLREELTLARLNGRPPWDALTGLAEELGLPELSDFAGIMRLAGDEGAEIADILRARSSSLRDALAAREQAAANAASEQMVVPVATLGLVFMVILIAPAILRIM